MGLYMTRHRHLDLAVRCQRITDVSFQPDCLNLSRLSPCTSPPHLQLVPTTPQHPYAPPLGFTQTRTIQFQHTMITTPDATFPAHSHKYSDTNLTALLARNITLQHPTPPWILRPHFLQKMSRGRVARSSIDEGGGVVAGEELRGKFETDAAGGADDEVGGHVIESYWRQRDGCGVCGVV